MIFIGLGANLPSDGYETPRETLEAALERIDRPGVNLVRRSPWYRSEPVPISDQPWYVNGVAQLETGLESEALLALLHEVEADFGRQRRERNEARPIDLDILCFHGRMAPPPARPELPHPRMHQRAFVLLPLADLVPDWRHPVSGIDLSVLIAQLPADQVTLPLDDG